jgi:hypothetical protein
MLGPGRTTAKFTKQLLKNLSLADGRYPQLGASSLANAAQTELKDVIFVDQMVKRTLNVLLPSFAIPSGWYFRPLLLGDKFAVDTNFDFVRLNEEYHKLIPPSHSTLSPEYLINHILEARGAMLMGFKHLGELVVDPATATLIKQITADLLRKRDAHIEEQDLFQELYLPEGRKIRECLNSGERNFAEFLKLLDHASTFKRWLGSRNPDEKLLREYFASATTGSWIDKLGTKGSRWIVTTGLGAAVETFYPTGGAIAAAQGLSLLDATLLDRILRGWRPNQFVEGRLASFVTPGK